MYLKKLFKILFKFIFIFFIKFHNGSNYDYHLIIKELVEKFERQFTCLGEKTEKYITFSVSLEKEVIRMDKNGKEIAKTISYRLQFIGSARSMATHFQILLIILSREFIKLNI